MLPLISHVRVCNFRSIREADIELKPLTLLVGPNASGKSTIIYSIQWMILKAKNNPTLTSSIHSSERELLGVNAYEDLVFNRDLNKNWMGVELTINIPEELAEELDSFIERVNWEALGLAKPKLQRLTHGFKIGRNPRNEHDYELSTTIDGLTFTLRNWYNALDQRYYYHLDALNRKVKREGRKSCSLFDELYLKAELGQDWEQLDNLIEAILKRVRVYLVERFPSPLISLRGVIPLDCPASEGVKQDVGSQGRCTVEAATYIYATRDMSVRAELQAMASFWFDKFGLKDFGAGVEGDRFKAGYKDLIGCNLPLAFGSYGHRQLATLIVQLTVSPRQSVIMVEEPEISLHPEAQALLPLLFADVIKKHGKQIIATTHSSILILALSDAVMGAEGYENVPRLNVEDIAVYEVRRGKDGATVIEPIELTKEGYPKGGIPSFVRVEKKLYERMLSRLPEES